MRILQVVQKPQRRGAEIFNFQLAGLLAGEGHEVRTVYLYNYDGDRPLPLREGDVLLEGVESHWTEKAFAINLSLLRRLCSEIEAFDPDIVQVNGSRTVKYGAAAKRLLGGRVRWKLIYRNIDIPSFWIKPEWRLTAYRRLVMSQMDAAIGICDFSMEDANRSFRLRIPNITVHNRIDPRELVTPEDRGSFRARNGAAPDDVILLFLGSMVRQKRPDRFLRVAAQVLARHPEARVWMVGDGPLRKDAEALASEVGIADRCTFFGHQKNVADYLNAADVMMLSSDTEGLPGVALEAGYLKLPVVATNVGGVAEGVLHGRTGFVVEKPFEETLVPALDQLVSDRALRLSFGNNAHETVASRFTIDTAVEPYIRFYEHLIRDGGSPQVAHQATGLTG